MLVTYLLAAILAGIFLMIAKKYNIGGAKKLSEKDIKTVALSAQRLVDIINESLQIVKTTQDPVTRHQRVLLAKEKLADLKYMIIQFPFLSPVSLPEVERTILLFQSAYCFDDWNSPNPTIPTYEYVEGKKHDLETMQKCCMAEIRGMEATGIIAAPYYFERVAILYRKAKEYEKEIKCCNAYIKLVEDFYRKHGTADRYDVRTGGTYHKIVTRLPKAKELFAKQQAKIQKVPHENCD